MFFHETLYFFRLEASPNPSTGGGKERPAGERMVDLFFPNPFGVSNHRKIRKEKAPFPISCLSAGTPNGGKLVLRARGLVEKQQSGISDHRSYSN
ncbi:MAG: hypothetical protein C0397_01905 [Odoribacter sp.]|nr:hypothetical protein [Odoribacter sp.]